MEHVLEAIGRWVLDVPNGTARRTTEGVILDLRGVRAVYLQLAEDRAFLYEDPEAGTGEYIDLGDVEAIVSHRPAVVAHHAR